MSDEWMKYARLYTQLRDEVHPQNWSFPLFCSGQMRYERSNMFKRMRLLIIRCWEDTCNALVCWCSSGSCHKWSVKSDHRLKFRLEWYVYDCDFGYICCRLSTTFPRDTQETVAGELCYRWDVSDKIVGSHRISRSNCERSTWWFAVKQFIDWIRTVVLIAQLFLVYLEK